MVARNVPSGWGLNLPFGASMMVLMACWNCAFRRVCSRWSVRVARHRPGTVAVRSGRGSQAGLPHRRAGGDRRRNETGLRDLFRHGEHGREFHYYVIIWY